MKAFFCLLLFFTTNLFSQVDINAPHYSFQKDQIGFTVEVNKKLFSTSSNNNIHYDTLILSKPCHFILYFNDKITDTNLTINKQKNLLLSKSSKIIFGDTLIFKSTSLPPPDLTITEIGVISVSKNQRKRKDFGDAGNCLINVNCSEGDQWQKQKRSTLRILTKVSGRILECSGALINNTNRDNIPYVITAEHCANVINTDIYASQSDINDWLFYFNYESENCSLPIDESQINYATMTGATLIAQSKDRGGDFGSDFFLVRLNDTIPRSYNAYLSGWSREDIPATSGVSIHHPSFDIKKISTFTTPLVSDASIEGTPDAHWRVNWSATTNGHSITEGGSSGAPLFNQEGLLIGTLNGGDASCNNLNGDDWYGKLSYSWESNGTAMQQQIKHYLAPGKLDTLAIKGQEYQPSINLPPITPPQNEKRIVFPNPTSGNITIQGASLEYSEVFSATGSFIYSSNDSTLDLSTRAPGLYILKVVFTDETLVYKVLKH